MQFLQGTGKQRESKQRRISLRLKNGYKKIKKKWELFISFPKNSAQEVLVCRIEFFSHSKHSRHIGRFRLRFVLILKSALLLKSPCRCVSYTFARTSIQIKVNCCLVALWVSGKIILFYFYISRGNSGNS